MCRWITLLSAEAVSLSDICLAPSNSLIQLSKDASFHPGYGELNNHNMNGDGFGVGWYHANAAMMACNDQGPVHALCAGDFNNGNALALAAVFKDTQPAWNNANLRELCLATRSHCIMAHVRSASKNSGISQQNCHPFKAGRLLFCHNGRIDEYYKIRRRLVSPLSEEAYQNVRGTTDSETIFGLIVTFLSQDGEGKVSPFYQTTPFGAERLIRAIRKVLRTIEILVQEAGVQGYCTCNFSLADGDTVVCTRYCDQDTVPPPSLYFAFGNAKELYMELTNEDQALMNESRHPAMSDTASQTSDDNGNDTASEISDSFEVDIELRERVSAPGQIYSDVSLEQASFIVASNPLTRTHTWHAMPRNSFLWHTRGSLPELRLIRTRSRNFSLVRLD